MKGKVLFSTIILFIAVGMISLSFGFDTSEEAVKLGDMLCKFDTSCASHSTSDNVIYSANGKEFKGYARRGCCSHHGGVCGCDEATRRVICCDGTVSPTCT